MHTEKCRIKCLTIKHQVLWSKVFFAFVLQIHMIFHVVSFLIKEVYLLSLIPRHTARWWSNACFLRLFLCLGVSWSSFLNQFNKFSFIAKKDNLPDTDANGFYKWGRVSKLMSKENSLRKESLKLNLIKEVWTDYIHLISLIMVLWLKHNGIIENLWITKHALCHTQAYMYLWINEIQYSV